MSLTVTTLSPSKATFILTGTHPDKTIQVISNTILSSCGMSQLEREPTEEGYRFTGKFRVFLNQEDFNSRIKKIQKALAPYGIICNKEREAS